METRNPMNSIQITCFGVGEQGHIKADCPNKSKEKRTSYKEKKGKTKRAYIAWDENEVSSSSLHQVKMKKQTYVW